MVPSLLQTLLLFFLVNKCNAFNLVNILSADKSLSDTEVVECSSSVVNQQRRAFLTSFATGTLSTIITSVTAVAEDDLASQLYNPDGSIKEGVSTVAAERSIQTIWSISDDGIVNVDNVNNSNAASESGTKVKLSYQVPEKWAMPSPGTYLDKSENNRKACNHVTIYQAPGKVTNDRLDKATSLGVGKALNVPDTLNAIRSGDLIGGRKTKNGDQTYYEFDLATAPKTCGESKENLGLGFCPYESIYLLSATIIQDHLYAIVVECDNNDWKIANADLKRLRSSFRVDIS